MRSPACTMSTRQRPARCLPYKNATTLLTLLAKLATKQQKRVP